MRYTCPVCGYNQLEDAPANHEICPSCGTEFGYHDFTRTHAELTKGWLLKGAQWHSKAAPPPPDWNPYGQLLNLQNSVENNASETQNTEVIAIKLGENISMLEGYKSQGHWYGVGNWHPLKRTANNYEIEIHA